MGLDALVHPVGPHRPRVYWTRRLGLLVLVVVLVAGIARACSGDGGRPVAGEPAATPSSSATSPSGKPARCAPPALAATATADAASYPAGVLPRITVQVRNTGEATCRLAVDGGARVWTIRSGSDRVYSTADCGHPGPRRLQPLAAGAGVTYALTWDRHRSIEGCASPGADAAPGTYRAVVVVDGARAKPVVFHLTD